MGVCAVDNRFTQALDARIQKSAGGRFRALNSEFLEDQPGAGICLLQKPVIDAAVHFQGHRRTHRDALIATIKKLGGQPVAEMKLQDCAKALNASALKSQADVLDLAARLAADETTQFTVLNDVLGRSLPPGAFSVGA